MPMAVERTRVPFAVAVNASTPFPALTDGIAAGLAFVEGAALARVPDHPVVARSAEDLVVSCLGLRWRGHHHSE